MQEGRWPQGPLPFLEGVAFSDNFHYPDGALVGQGSWAATTIGAGSPTVSAHTAIGTIGAQKAAIWPNAFPLADKSLAWWMEVQFTPTAAEATNKVIYLFVGDPLAPWNVIEGLWRSGFTGPTQIRWTYGDPTTETTQFTATVGDLTRSHSAAVSWDPLTGSWTLWIDGVAVDNFVGGDPVDLTDGQCGIFISTGAVTNQPHIEYIEVGIGPYT